jgi:hypothetical protein
MQKIIQITDVTLDELVDRISKTIAEKYQPEPARQVTPGKIIVLNKRETAKVLNISESLFDKLHSRGLIPQTVNCGLNKNGEPIKRWCQDHIIAIKSTILSLKHSQSNDQYLQAKLIIHKILGL